MNLWTVTIILHGFDVENNLQLQGKTRIFFIQSDWSLLKLQQDPFQPILLTMLSKSKSCNKVQYTGTRH